MLFKKTWFQILIVGVLLFIGSEQALKYTANIHFVPTVLLVGSFAVPLTLVAYFYSGERALDRLIHPDTPLIPVVMCFFIGGVVSVIVAGFLEYQAYLNLSILGLFGVGLIEEAAKMIFPLGLYLNRRYRSEMDGLLFGIASGMAFAALETMGYGLVALIDSQGKISSLEEVLLIRGLLSPFGHSAWTALICASLWRARNITGKTFNAGVVWTYLFVVFLHFLWNVSGSSSNPVFSFTGFFILGAVSLWLVIARWNEAKRSSPLSAH